MTCNDFSILVFCTSMCLLVSLRMYAFIHALLSICPRLPMDVY
jgi:hypothetical protein